jgi:alpha-beta hydrolase superfamily lysophospholipase
LQGQINKEYNASMYVKTAEPATTRLLWISSKRAGTTVSDKWQQGGRYVTSAGGLKLYVRHWLPPGTPRAVVHIVHGMAEHSLRYERFARSLVAAGIAVWAADMRGHGKTADPAINNLSEGGLLGHCADNDALSHVCADLDCVNKIIGEALPDTPLFMFGHSWGSLLAQHYIESYGHRLSGCILSGTRGPDGLKIRAGVPLMLAIAALNGGRKSSSLAYSLVDGPYNKPFKPNRTVFDWLSRDEAEVNAYIADPLCGQRCSAGFYRDLLLTLNTIHRPEALSAIKRDLPIYVISGSADPVGDMGDSPTALVNSYRAIGIHDLEFVLYPDARHELLNETNRDEVTENLLVWIEKHCELTETSFPQTL